MKVVKHYEKLLFTFIYATERQDNLSKAERNRLAKLVDILVEAWIAR